MGVTIRQRTTGGPWWVFIARQGKRRSKCVGAKSAAKDLAKELQRALAAGDLGLLAEPEPSPEPLTVAMYVDRYLADVEPELQRSTYRDYVGCLRRQIVPALGTRPLMQLTRRDVKDFAATLRATGLSDVNMRKHLRILSSVLSAAVDDEVLTANPAISTRRTRRSRNGQAACRRIDPLTREEPRTLLETARDHAVERGERVVHPFRPHYPFLLTLARTGLRLGEAIALEWGDIDWQGGCLHVRRAFAVGEVSTPKNGKARRVYLSAQLRDVLRTLYAERAAVDGVAADAEGEAAQATLAGEVLGQLVFTDSAGGRLDAHNFRRRVFQPLLAVAGLRRVCLHDLRHTYASLLLAEGRELHFVQDQLGHHSPSFTLSRYGHLVPRDRRHDVNCLDDAAPGCTPAAPGGENGVLLETAQKQKPLISQGLS